MRKWGWVVGCLVALWVSGPASRFGGPYDGSCPALSTSLWGTPTRRVTASRRRRRPLPLIAASGPRTPRIDGDGRRMAVDRCELCRGRFRRHDHGASTPISCRSSRPCRHHPTSSAWESVAMTMICSSVPGRLRRRRHPRFSQHRSTVQGHVRKQVHERGVERCAHDRCRDPGHPCPRPACKVFVVGYPDILPQSGHCYPRCRLRAGTCRTSMPWRRASTPC